MINGVGDWGWWFFDLAVWLGWLVYVGESSLPDFFSDLLVAFDLGHFFVVAPDALERRGIGA
jgi:hypothetical protein